MTLRHILLRLAWLVGPPAAVGLSLWARHGWVQAHELAVWCGQHANQHPCPWRDAVIQAFIDHRLSTAAFVLAGIAWMAHGAARQCIAWVGLVISCFGLVLYDADRCAASALCCMLLGLSAKPSWRGGNSR